MVQQPIYNLLSQWAQRQWPILIGLLVLFLPTISRLNDHVWIHSDQAHGPLILLVVSYLFWLKKPLLTQAANAASRIFGFTFFLIGLLLYIIGSSQALIPFEAASAIFVIIGLLSLQHGFKALTICWFPIFFMIFMVPLPGSLLDVITVPMKMAVSTVAEQVLYWFGYPVARNGVIIQISQYQLFVANACAGMHTLISLEALGLLYITLVKHASFMRNMLLGLLIIPISFTANVIRVMALVLITYYFGDTVAQGFIHSFASVFLFAIALVLIVSLDTAIQRLVKV